jgi:uncharacterized protein (DUF362 family)/Pyruvate/2-oxoacid:ferredoxin oxidoreductase delta subunit
MHLVALEKAESYSRCEVKKRIESLLSYLGGIKAFVSPGDRVLLKPNMLSAKQPEAAVTTHPEIVRAVIELVRDAGGIPLVGDSPGVGRLVKVAETSGILKVVKETGAELVEFKESLEIAGEGVFKRFELARPYLEADRVINLPKLKTHEMMTMTCSVKNLFGAVVGMAKPAWHLKAGEDRLLFAEMLLDIYRLRKPDLNIVDAIVAMEGDGPSSGNPRTVGLLLAGVNPVAVDVIAGEILGIPKNLLYVERAAQKMGIGGAHRKTISTLGYPLSEVRINGFILPRFSSAQFGLPRFLARFLRNHLTACPYPIPEKCILCGICRDACPPRAMEILNGELRIDYRRCIRCFCCRELCPENALGIRKARLLGIINKYI